MNQKSTRQQEQCPAEDVELCEERKPTADGKGVTVRWFCRRRERGGMECPGCGAICKTTEVLVEHAECFSKQEVIDSEEAAKAVADSAIPG